MLNRFIFVIIFFAQCYFLISCQSNEGELEAKLKLCVGIQMDSLKGKSALLVIPINGCGPCIDKGKYFFRSNHENPNLYFLFSGAYERDIRIELHADSLLLSKENVIIKGNYFSDKTGITESNLAIFYVENGKVNKLLKVTPFDVDESLENLEEYLRKK